MMTRDAKIGLLVGLAFILIVGILLSEHITTATNQPQAELAQAGDRVRRATEAPVAPPPAAIEPKADPNPAPRQIVVTREQLDSPEVPSTVRVELGQPKDGQIKVIRIDQPGDPIASAQPVVPAQQPAVESKLLAATNEPTGPTGVTAPTTLERAAAEQGVELVAIDGTPVQPTVVSEPIANGAKVREYVAKSGDSLSRIASRELGSNTPANRQLIINLNPSLQKNNDRILIGATYLLPADVWAAALGMPSEPTAQPASASKTLAPAAPTDVVVYTVKPGDSLWKIADREVGNASAVGQIKQLNADVLGESETVKVGMKLKLPAKK